MNYVFDADEVILLEDDSISYNGSVENLDYLEKVILTNKRIIGVWVEKRTEKTFEIGLDQIKKYNGQPQVGEYEDDEIGECLRIQTICGNECFALNDSDDESLKETFKSMFSSKKKVNKNIALWVGKINEAVIGCDKPAPQAAPVKEAVTQPETKTVVEEVMICAECGTKMPTGTKFCPSCGTPANQPKVVEKVVEVIRCRKCGAKMNADTKFCPSCGTPVVEEPKAAAPVPPVPSVAERKETKQNKVQKCPICGEIIPSDALTCPSCGHEVRGREAVGSVQAFFDKISSIDNEDKKIEAIKMYVIPNNKEDIMEFMFLAVSNFDAKLYATNKQGENIAGAWYTKIEQCYKKAMIMFTDPNDIAKIEKMYKETQTETKNIKKTKLIMTVSGIAAIILSILLIMIGTPRDAEGNAQAGPLSYIAMAILAVGIIVLVLGLKKKKTNKQLEEERIAKMNNKNKK